MLMFDYWLTACNSLSSHHLVLDFVFGIYEMLDMTCCKMNPDLVPLQELVLNEVLCTHLACSRSRAYSIQLQHVAYMLVHMYSTRRNAQYTIVCHSV